MTKIPPDQLKKWQEEATASITDPDDGLLNLGKYDFDILDALVESIATKAIESERERICTNPNCPDCPPLTSSNEEK